MRHRGTSGDTVPMLDYVDRRFDDLAARVQLLDNEIDRRVSTLQEAITLSREAMEHRLAAMNEWRAQANDRQRDFPTRDVLDEVAKGLRDQDVQQEARLRRLEERITSDEGGSRAATALKAGQRTNLTTVIAIITTVLFLVSIVVSAFLAARH